MNILKTFHNRPSGIGSSYWRSVWNLWETRLRKAFSKQKTGFLTSRLRTFYLALVINARNLLFQIIQGQSMLGVWGSCVISSIGSEAERCVITWCPNSRTPTLFYNSKMKCDNLLFVRFTLHLHTVNLYFDVFHLFDVAIYIKQETITHSLTDSDINNVWSL